MAIGLIATAVVFEIAGLVPARQQCDVLDLDKAVEGEVALASAISPALSAAVLSIWIHDSHEVGERRPASRSLPAMSCTSHQVFGGLFGSRPPS